MDGGALGKVPLTSTKSLIGLMDLTLGCEGPCVGRPKPPISVVVISLVAVSDMGSLSRDF